MKYTKEERLDIGRRIYDGELTRYEAAKEYEISEQTARNYMQLYAMSTIFRRERARNISVALPKQDLRRLQRGWKNSNP